VNLIAEELDFAYTTWRAFPDRIVGYQSRSHFWSDPKVLLFNRLKLKLILKYPCSMHGCSNVFISQEQWRYSSKLTNDYSIILNGAAIYHVYYNHMYWTKIPPAALMVIESLQNCEDIAFNILVAKITRKPPIKLTLKKAPKDTFSRYLFLNFRICY